MPFDSANWPATTSVMKSGAARDGRLTYSTTVAMTASVTTPDVPPSWLMVRIALVDQLEECCAPKRANLRSNVDSPDLDRIIATTNPMPTPAARTIDVATDSATPVSVFGLKCRRRWSASLWCLSTSAVNV